MSDAVDPRLESAAVLLRDYAEDEGDEAARDLARVLELGDVDPPEGVTVADSTWLREVQRRTAEWREETINGSTTALTQTAHTAVEVCEALDPILKAETYEGVPLGDSCPPERQRRVEEAGLEKELGDVAVAWLGACSELGLDAVECMEAALDKNGSREWEGWQE